MHSDKMHTEILAAHVLVQLITATKSQLFAHVAKALSKPDTPGFTNINVRANVR
jgi:hypothetical protein